MFCSYSVNIIYLFDYSYVKTAFGVIMIDPLFDIDTPSSSGYNIKYNSVRHRLRTKWVFAGVVAIIVPLILSKYDSSDYNANIKDSNRVANETMNELYADGSTARLNGIILTESFVAGKSAIYKTAVGKKTLQFSGIDTSYARNIVPGATVILDVDRKENGTVGDTLSISLENIIATERKQ